jgi:hypothetical protein
MKEEVVPRDDDTLSIVFENGERGILDMRPMPDFGAFQRIKDYETVRRVRVSFDTIEWSCGVDLDPEFVHAKCKASMPA